MGTKQALVTLIAFTGILAAAFVYKRSNTRHIAAQPAAATTSDSQLTTTHHFDSTAPLGIDTKQAQRATPSDENNSGSQRSLIRAYTTDLINARRRPTDPGSAAELPYTIRDTQLELHTPEGHRTLVVGVSMGPMVLKPGKSSTPLDDFTDRSPTAVEIVRTQPATQEAVRLQVEGFFESPVDPTTRLPWRWDGIDAGGGLVIPTVDGKVLITASAGTAVGSWHGSMPIDGNRLAIELHDPVSARGVVSSFPTGLEDPAHVTVRLLESEVEQVLGQVGVEEDGHWLMTGIPRIPNASYLFRIVHPRATPNQSKATFPPGIPSIDVDLAWTEGRAQQVKVTTLSDAPVASACVVMQWTDESGWNRAHSITDPKGLAWFRNGPEAAAYFRILGSEHSEEAQGPWNVPTHSTQTIPIRALPAASIEGQVSPTSLASAGFTVAYWTQDGAPSIRSFGPEAQGKFRLNKLVKETYYFSARSANGSSSATSPAVDLKQKPFSTVALELQPARMVAGRVVGHSDGKGIVGANVSSRWISATGRLIQEFPGSATSGPGGYFQDLAVPAGPITLLAKAEGMAYETIDYPAQQEQAERLPPIRLKSLGRLAVELVGRPDQLSEYRFLYEHIAGTKTQNFSSDGLAVFPACSPSDPAYISIETPVGSLIQLTISMPSGQPWDVPIAIATGHTFLADFTSVARAGFTGPFQIRSIYRDQNHFQVIHTRHAKDPNHTYTFTDLPAVPCTFVLFDGTEQVAIRTVDLSSTGSETIALDPMGGRGIIRLTSTQEGQLIGASVHLASKALLSHPIAVSKRSDGVLELSEVEPGPAVLTVKSDAPPQSLFVEECVVVEEPASITEIEVRHDATVRLQTVSTGGEPLSLPVFVSHESSPHSRLEVAGVTEQDMHLIKVSPGTYGWRLNAPGYWPEGGWMEARPGPNSLVIQARRSGSVSIQGPPSTRIVVWSDADGHATVSWADLDGRLASSKTDASGNLNLVLPEGPYRAWIEGQGAAGSSDFVVVAGESVSHSLPN